MSWWGKRNFVREIGCKPFGDAMRKKQGFNSFFLISFSVFVLWYDEWTMGLANFSLRPGKRLALWEMSYNLKDMMSKTHDIIHAYLSTNWY